MPAVTYSEQTRFAFCDGVTLRATSAGASLHSPPRDVELTDLADGQVRALSTLNQGPKTVSEIAAQAGGEDVATLIDRLADGGWLAVTVRDAGRDLYTIHPFAQPVPRPDHPLPSWSATLSKFAVLHRDSGGFVLEHPRSWCTLRIHDPRLLALLDGLGSADANLPIAVKTQFAEDLHWCGFLVADGWAEENEPGAREWSAADLWFHRRGMRGDEPASRPADDFARQATRRPAYLGEPVPLPTPDPLVMRASDPSLAAVMQDRVRTRAFDEARPITIEQLGELLYRTARSRATDAQSTAREGSSGIELYPVVRAVTGLAAGMYHYDSSEHVLRPVAPADSPSVRRMLASSAHRFAADGGDGPDAAETAGAGGAGDTTGRAPQALIVFGARAGLVMGEGARAGYATILRHAGMLTQTLSLAGTAMGIGVCAQSFTDAEAFATATGNDELEECGVGAVVVGTPAR